MGDRDTSYGPGAKPDAQPGAGPRSGRDSGRAGYEIHIRGRISGSLRLAFEGLSITVKPIETVLRGVNLDQAALYGILDRIQALGLELIEIRRIPSTDQR